MDGLSVVVPGAAPEAAWRRLLWLLLKARRESQEETACPRLDYRSQGFRHTVMSMNFETKHPEPEYLPIRPVMCGILGGVGEQHCGDSIRVWSKLRYEKQNQQIDKGASTVSKLSLTWSCTKSFTGMAYQKQFPRASSRFSAKVSIRPTPLDLSNNWTNKPFAPAGSLESCVQIWEAGSASW